MALGLVKVIPASQHAELMLSGTGGGHVYASVSILNPNDGVIYVARNRDCLSVNYGDWDWKVPSQSYALLPGDFSSVGMFYLDQSGAGHQGEISVYPGDAAVAVPLFQSIGRALQAQATALDITEGTTPANPGAGVARLWADALDHLHILRATGADDVVMDYAVPLGGVLTGFLPNPGMANNVVGNAQLVGGTALANIGIGGMSAAYLQDGTVDATDLAANAYLHTTSSGPSGGISTSSTSPVNTDLAALGFVWVSGQPGMCIVSLTVQNNTAGAIDRIWLSVSGIGTFFAGEIACPSANTDYALVGLVPLNLASGTYDFRVQFGVASGTGAINAGVSGSNNMYLMNPRP